MKKTILLLGLLIIALVLVGIVVYFKGHKVENSEQKNSESTSTVSDLQVAVVAEGQGDAAAIGDTVTVNYTGKFEDGKAFDSNIDPTFGHVEPFQFLLGSGQVIPGWDKGVMGMKVGEKRHLVIPSSLAYGPNGYGPIPGGATLVFDVELVAIKHK